MSRSGVPYVALALMLIPVDPDLLVLRVQPEFYSWTLAATMVIAITFAGSAIVAAILPWRKPDIYNASLIAKYRIAGIPLVTVTAVGFLALLGFCSTSGSMPGVRPSTTRGRCSIPRGC